MILLRDILPTTSVRYSGDSTRGDAGSGPRAPLRCALALSFLFLLGGVLTAEQTVATPLEHGWWLSAFFLLVGCLAPLLLVGGRILLTARAPRAVWQWAEIALWNLGAIGVALGVLDEAPSTVLMASGAMLCSLALYVVGLIRSPSHDAHTARLRMAYYALATLLAASVLVGTALAAALPTR